MSDLSFSLEAYETAWCPGCGNFDIREALVLALNKKGLKTDQVLFVSGIGQAAKMPQYITGNYFNGLHGRALATATGAKLANPNLEVIVNSGDGCFYGEGGNHFLAALRRNIGLTVLVHNNQIYGLTKGQASPTSEAELISKSQPFGVMEQQFNPISTAIGLGAGFVARAFSGEKKHLVELIVEAISYPGLALLDILMPCISFNKINTYAWYKKRVKILSNDYDYFDRELAFKTALKWGDEIPIGIIYKAEKLLRPLEEKWPFLENTALTDSTIEKIELKKIAESFLI